MASSSRAGLGQPLGLVQILLNPESVALLGDHACDRGNLLRRLGGGEDDAEQGT